MNQKVTYIAETIPKIILNRPKNNPLDLQTLKELIAAFEASAENNDSCVLFLAKGTNFTVGADLKYIYSVMNKPDYLNEFMEFSQGFQDVTRSMINHPGVIIIGLHGWVIGGGFEISLAADLRIATYDVKIKLPELSIGTMFSNGSTKLLGEIVGLGRAKEIMFIGDTIDADKSYAIGLINQICETEELETIMNELALRIIKEKDPHAIKVAKQLINENKDLDLNTTLEKEMLALTKFGIYDGFKAKITEFINK